MSWYLMIIATQAYLGPFTGPDCVAAAAGLQDYGVVCRQALSSYACEIGGRPGASAICPLFAIQPQVTIKQKQDRLQ